MSPALCYAKYIRKYLKKRESEFGFPFHWVDYRNDIYSFGKGGEFTECVAVVCDDDF